MAKYSKLPSSISVWDSEIERIWLDAMRKIKSIEDALNVFVEASENHTLGTLNGDYKLANKSYGRIVQAVDSLKNDRAIESLEALLSDKSQSAGVRSWAATYLLPINETLAVSTLSDIAKGDDIIAGDAGLVISEWRKGHLTNL